MRWRGWGLRRTTGRAFWESSTGWNCDGVASLAGGRSGLRTLTGTASRHTAAAGSKLPRDKARAAASTEDREDIEAMVRPQLKDHLVHDLRRTAAWNVQASPVSCDEGDRTQD